MEDPNACIYNVQARGFNLLGKSIQPAQCQSPVRECHQAPVGYRQSSSTPFEGEYSQAPVSCATFVLGVRRLRNAAPRGPSV